MNIPNPSNDSIELSQLSSSDTAINVDLVSKKELRAWYLFSFAAEPTWAAVNAIFFPVILQALANGAAFQLDHTTPCNVNTTGTNPCVVQVGSWWIDTSAYPIYINSLAVFIQAIFFVSFSSLADHGNLRKIFMIVLGILSSIVNLLFLVIVSSSMYWFAAILIILSNLFIGGSYVFLYAYVPILTINHPDVADAKKESNETYLEKYEHVANSISSHGFSAGYVGSIIALIISIGIILLAGSGNTYSFQIATAFIGVWCLAFLYFPLRHLKSRPGPPLPEGCNWLTYSWTQVFKTFRKMKHLMEAFKFLMAWFLVSDAVNTLISVAVLFAIGTLQMSKLQILLAATLTPLAGGVGVYVWLFIQRKLKLSSRQMVMIISSLYAVLPAYGLLGFVADIGLKHIWEVWMVVIWHGMMIGALQSFCRVMFSELLPKGQESEFFGLYEITDKGSSWIGGLATAAIGNATHNLRYSFWLLLAMFVLPAIIVWFVDPKKGKREAENFAKK